MSYRDEVRRVLESNAARKVQNEFLEEAKRRQEALRRFVDIDDLLALLRDRDGDPDAKDAALVALVSEHQRGGDGRAFAVLAVAMFPRLDRLYNARRHLLHRREHDDLWGRVVEAFAEALERYPTAHRPRRVAANIDGETMAALRRARERDERVAEARVQFAVQAIALQQDLERMGDADAAAEASLGDLVEPGREPSAPPDADEFRAAVRALDPYVAAGVIDEADRFLILGVHLYERTLRDLAAELGISREAAKKRHRRALDRLQNAGPRRR